MGSLSFSFTFCAFKTPGNLLVKSTRSVFNIILHYQNKVDNTFECYYDQ